MAVPADSASNVAISLSVDGMSSAHLPFPERRIMLGQAMDSIVIGRASKTPSKGYVAERDNGWFDSPVMSRRHAEIVSNFKEKKVEIRDLGSLHGTYLNDSDEKISEEKPQELKDGDSIRFGVAVWRGTESFTPTTVKIGIAFDRRDDRASSTFQVPEGSDDGSDMDGYSSDDSRKIPGRYSTNMIDLTQRDHAGPSASTSNSRPNTMNHHNRNLIDLSSPPGSSPGSAVLIGDDDDDDTESVEFQNNETLDVVEDTISSNMPSAWHGEPAYHEAEVDEERDAPADNISEYDMHSIHYSTDEEDGNQTDSDEEGVDDGSSPSDLYGYDMDDMDSDLDSFAAEMDEIAEGVADGLDGAVEYMQTGLKRVEWDVNGSSDNEEPDDESSDEDAPRDRFWLMPQDKTAAILGLESTSSQLFSNRNPPAASVATVAPEAPVSAPKASAIVTICGLLNEDKPEQPLLPSSISSALTETAERPPPFAQRRPSPSDVVMSKSYLHNPPKPLTAEASLGASDFKTRRLEFFEAREQTRALAEAQRTDTARRLQSSVHTLCNDHESDLGRSNHLVVALGSTATKAPDPFVGFPPLSGYVQSSTLDQSVAVPELAGSVTASSVPEALVDCQTLLKGNNTDVAEQAKSNRDLLSDVHRPGGSSSVVDPLSRRTYLDISDIVDGCQQDRPGIKQGKRKVEEISISSVAEERWAAHEKEAASGIPTPVSPVSLPSPGPSDVPALAPVDESVSRRSASQSPPRQVVAAEEKGDAEVVVTEGRPMKRLRLRHIAERVGYAALGGVTAGAVIVGTLIYTAPTF